MKILSAHQSSYLPWLGFFHKILLCDEFIILDEVQFEKNSFSNRNKIRSKSQEFWLTVPVKLNNHISKKSYEIEIDNNQKWKKKHLNSIEQNYKKSLYFEEFFPFFKDCFSQDWKYLDDLNNHLLKWCLKILKIDTKISKMSEYQITSNKAELIIEICRKTNADIFVFGALGKNYAISDDFKKHNIQIYFQEYNHPEYKQITDDFIPYLSIIDLLFNYGKQATQILLTNNIQKHNLINNTL